MSIYGRYKSPKLVVVGYDFHGESGAWRSIYRYFRFCEARGENVMLIDRRKQGTFRQLICALLFSPKILFNGLSSFHRWEGILSCLLRKDIYLYLHDTEYMLAQFGSLHPWKHRVFRWILTRNPILVVSNQMEAHYLRSLGVKNCSVVREAVILPSSPDFDPDERHVVMVGSLDERKGVRLFSEVARLAKERRLNWRFHWVGALASQTLGELSRDVSWWGWHDSPSEFIRKADVFFLSSVDDPLPLACLEALMLGKRCVVYRGTGIAELVEGVRGCGVMESYSSEEAIERLEVALNEGPDVSRIVEIAAKEASLPALVKRIDDVISV